MGDVTFGTILERFGHPSGTSLDSFVLMEKAETGEDCSHWWSGGSVGYLELIRISEDMSASGASEWICLWWVAPSEEYRGRGYQSSFRVSHRDLFWVLYEVLEYVRVEYPTGYAVLTDMPFEGRAGESIETLLGRFDMLTEGAVYGEHYLQEIGSTCLCLIRCFGGWRLETRGLMKDFTLKGTSPEDVVEQLRNHLRGLEAEGRLATRILQSSREKPCETWYERLANV